MLTRFRRLFAAALVAEALQHARLSRIGLALLTIQVSLALAHAATNVPAPGRPLRVATAPTAPFVLPNTDPLSGFSIDLWNEVARRIPVDFAWIVVPTADLLPAVQRNDADVAIAAITMTVEREKAVDFSHPYFDSGLQIMVRASNESRLRDVFQSVPWRAIGQLFGVAIIIMLLLANVLWLVERRVNPKFNKRYLQAIGEGLWGTVLIIATGEHGDRDAPRVIKRITVACVWLLGIVVIAQLTATVTSSQTVQRLQSSIQGPGDLPGKTIATVPGTIAADYLTQLGLRFVGVTNAADGIRMLTQGDVQAIVFDAPTLQYWAAKRGNRALRIVGPIFRPEKYGIAVADGSPLRKPIDEALLAIYEDGTYEDIYAKWFSRGK